MAKDFSAKQIRVSQLIASGAISGTHASIAIYSASDASNLQGGYSATSMFKGVGDDVFLFVSGTRDGRGRTGTTHPGNITLFGGDVVVSGTFYAEKLIAEIDATSTGSLSISGSAYIQHGLFVSGADGRNMHILAPSLFDGNMHISGNVSDFALTGTIKNAAAKIVESSVATEIETDAGALTLDGKTGVNLQANGTTVLSVGPAGTYLSSSVSDFALTGTIKNSASKIIESSVATEIETDAGALTLDGKTGINLQANGTTVLSVGPAGTYLSSSVSDFALTGTIKNSAAKVIESSVATEIETTAGILTLDGKTGIRLQEDGASVIAIDSQRNVTIGQVTDFLYLSSSVSDFKLTGTIKNSAAKVIESSVATEIETNAGALTLDGRTGIILQTSGSMLMSVGSGSIYISGSVSDFALSGTIKNTAAKVIESAVATEIETTAGSLTIDGKTGINLQANGTTVLSVGPAGTYLSSSVSDFALTGTIKNSASKIIESSVATEIETTAGALTLDGKTGINLQENGTTLIALDNGQNVIIGTAGKQIQLSGSVSDFALTGTIKNSAAKVIESSVATEIETRAGALTLDGAAGVDLQYSGSSYIKLNSGSIVLGDLSGSNTLGVAPPDIYISGAVQSNLHLSGSVFASKLSGSLTTLADGTEYMIAGANITINTGSDGSLTISTDLSPGGSDTQVQFNDGGSFEGDSGLVFNKTSNLLTAGQLHTTGKASFSGSVSDFALTGTIKNSASKVIESSVATEIETDSGNLTLDGKTGIRLQEDGSDVIVIDTGRNVKISTGPNLGIYLSGTLSDFAISGTIKTSASKVIESSVATEIESTGSLTLDGASSIALQANGTQIIAVSPSGVYLSGSVSDFALSGTIKNSASKIIESSVATEIETDAGILTLDGKTGIQLQEDGTNVIVIDNQRNITIGVLPTKNLYLSSSVSDFKLTGTIKSTAAKVIESAVTTEIETSAGALTLDGKTGVNLQTDGTTMFSVGPAGVYISGSVSGLEITGTIRNSAAKVIESSVATEIETDAGALTLDGKTGVVLQANGTTVLSVGPAGTYLSSSVSDFALTGTIKNSATKVIESSVATEIETKTGTLTLDGAAGIDLQHSGSSYIKLNSGSIVLGDLSGSNTLGVAPPDIYVSGAVQSSLHLSGSVFASKLSGSLTTLADGTEYMIAGAGVSITTGSSGALTISTALSVAGSDTQVQFNDDGSFAGDSGLTFNKTSNLLTAAKLHTTDNTHLSGSVSDFALTGTIKNSAAKVIQSSVSTEIESTAGTVTIDGKTGIALQVNGANGLTAAAGGMYLSASLSDFSLTGTIKNSAAKVIESSVTTEIETTAGALTLDGKTGVNIQANGTTVLSIGPAGTYLSSSVSDFALTGTIKNSAVKVIESSVATEIESTGSLTLDGASSVALQANGAQMLSVGPAGVYISGSVSGFLLTGTIRNSAAKIIESSVATEIETDAGALTLDGKTGVNLQANGTTIISVGPAGTYLSSSVSDFALTGTIKNSASKVIESSVATEIETDAGALTLDGKTGVNLQANGTTIISVGPAGMYLSSSVSDFSLTGTIKNSAAKVIESSVATEIETAAGALTLDGEAGVDLQYSGSSYIKLNSGSIVIGDLSGSNTLGVAPPDIYVSGAIQSELHLSGSVFADKLSGSLTTLANGNPYLVGHGGLTITTGSDGSVTLNIGATTNAFGTVAVSGQDNVVADQAGDTITFAAAQNMTITTNATSDTVTFTGIAGGGSSTVFNDRGHKATSTGSLSIAGPGHGLTYDATSVGGDVFFFVSGTIGSRNTSNTGSAVFGGDLVVSGNVTTLSSIVNYSSKVIESIVATEIETAAGALTLDGKTGVALQANGAQMLSVSPGGVHLSGSVSDFRITGSIKIDTSTALEAPATTAIKTLGGSWDIDGKTGVNLQTNGTSMLSVGTAGVYISGSVSGFELTGTIRNSAVKIIESSVATEIETDAGALTLDGKTGVALQANGTQMLSVGPKGVYLSGSVSDFLVTGTIKSDAAVALEAFAGTTIKTLGGSLSVDGAEGVELQHSGSAYIKLNSGSIVLGDLSGTLTLGVAPPNIYVSGAILSPLHVSGSVFADKLSGSLTTLADGTEYMIAGTNIIINTGSSGALTISAEGGSPGGSDTQVQFNDGGSFGGDAGFAFNKTSGLVSVVRLATEFSAHFSGSVSDFLMTGTLTMGSDIMPSANNTYNLGSDAVRWANVYTSDLHLKNERGNWTIVEEEDYLCVVNNRTGKRFKMMLEEIEE